jgi:hypothetical protein
MRREVKSVREREWEEEKNMQKNGTIAYCLF